MEINKKKDKKNKMDLSYQPPSSSFAPSFWERLYELKLNQFKLDTSEKTINARMRCSEGKISKSIEFDGSSFQVIMRDIILKGVKVQEIHISRRLLPGIGTENDRPSVLEHDRKNS